MTTIDRLYETTSDMARISALAAYNLDYDQLQSTLNDLSLLAAKVSGTQESRINLLDAYNQWTVAQQGIHQPHMDCEHSVCQYTIKEEKEFEIKNLSADLRFSGQNYVTASGLNYYYVPLKTTDGHPLGALCVMDSGTKTLSNEQKEMLQLISKEIISKLDGLKQTQILKNRIRELAAAKKMVAHDIRGPLGGIMGLAGIICEQGEDNSISEVLELTALIKESCRAVMELATDILNVAEPEAAITTEHLTNLTQLKQTILNLFAPRIKDKGIVFEAIISLPTAGIQFPKGNLLQITGNLVSNALKFTPKGGKVILEMILHQTEQNNLLNITVSDTGVGMDKVTVELILSGRAESMACTNGELGYGLGLSLVRQLVSSSGGYFSLSSKENTGTTFKVVIPLTQQNTTGKQDEIQP